MENTTDCNNGSGAPIQIGLTPLDRLICLIAQIEVEKYLKEVNHDGSKGSIQDENSHLRPL
jgi:hypothetical protein